MKLIMRGLASLYGRNLMSRIFIFSLIAISVFISFFYISGVLTPEEVIVEKKEIMIEVAFLRHDVGKKQPVKNDDFELVLIPESEMFEKEAYSSITLSDGALWVSDISGGVDLKQIQVSNPGERDYMFLSLSNDQVPYYYSSTGNSIVEALPIKPGDKVSFVATTSSKSNLLEDGYSDIDSLSSDVIINDAKVIQVIESSLETDSENENYSLIIALTVKQVLQLEMAQKIGAVTLVPAKLAYKYLSVKSSDLIEHRYGVRQLRGN